MRVNPTSKITFTYSSPLKTAWKKGLLPTVTKGLSGTPLKKDTVSVDHIVPHSKGGKTTLSNLVLEDAVWNNKRGNTPIWDWITDEMLEDYCKQFQDVYNEFINGNNYVKLIKETFAKLKKERK